MDGVFGGDIVHPTVESKVEKYGKAWLQKSRKKQHKLLLIELLYEYAKKTTLHGLGYVVEKGTHLIERGFWFLTFLMSLAMCFYLISNVWMKWKTSPVIVSFSERTVPVADVPFPSITICPEQKLKATVFNFSKFSYIEDKTPFDENLNDDASSLNTNINDMIENVTIYNKNNRLSRAEFEKLYNLYVVCNPGEYLIRNKFKTNSTLVEDIIEVAPKISEVLTLCFWRGKHYPCSELFDEVLTKKGVCFNFNALAANEILDEKNIQPEYAYLNTTKNSTDWSISEGYTDFTEESYPRRGLENQDNADLQIRLEESYEDRDMLCNVLKNGYTIYLQHPMDLPQASLYYYAAIPGQLTSLAVKVNKVSTANSLKNYLPSERQCYFPDDRKLRYFHIYSPSNCRLECQSNYTFKKCGCVWFHMPHNNSQEICTMQRKGCVQRALRELAIAETENHAVSNIKPCQCLPSCESVQYDAEVLKTNLFYREMISAYKSTYNFAVNKQLSTSNFSKIEIYFKEPRFISMRRSELFGVTDFLANCGGLLGLFLGFSFLSLVEIFYFGTLRFYFRLKKEIQKEKKKESDMKN